MQFFISGFQHSYTYIGSGVRGLAIIYLIVLRQEIEEMQISGAENLSSRNTSSFPSFLPFLALCMAENQHSFSLSSQHPHTVLSHPSLFNSQHIHPFFWRRKPYKSEFSPCYSQSPLQHSWDFYFFLLTQPLTYFYSSITLYCKGEWRKTQQKTIPTFLRFQKSIKKPQV